MHLLSNSSAHMPPKWKFRPPQHQDYGEWKPVPGFNDYVYASSLGYIVSWDDRHIMWSEPRTGNRDGFGYMTTKIYKKSYKVHRLICSAFHGESNLTVDHVNRNKCDNRALNLWWAGGTAQALNRGTAKRRRDGKPVLVWEVGADESTATMYDSVYCAQKATGAHASLLRKTAIGEYKQTAGFKAKYVTEEAVDLDGELFRPYGNISVSHFGRLRDHNGKIVTPTPLDGQVYATYDNQLFHRVVAACWPDIVGVKTQEDQTIDHINRNKLDNRASNLRWATKKEQRANQSN